MAGKVAVDPETEVQVMNGTGCLVRLAGREYHVKPLPIGKDMEFRSNLAAMLGEISGSVAGMAVPADGSEPENEATPIMDIGPADMKALMPVVLSKGFDSFVDLIFLYSPELRADKRYIMDHLPPGDDGIDELLLAGEAVFRLAAGRVKKILDSTERILDALMLPLS